MILRAKALQMIAFGVIFAAAWGPVGTDFKAQGVPTIATVAGGAIGDGGPSSDAILNRPSDVVVDQNGNIYLTEEFNERVRRIDAATGVITTVAGSGVTGYNGDGRPAITANLNKPEGLAIDAAGNIVIADFNNHRVRRVDVRTGMINTVVGDGFTDINGKGRFAGDGGQAAAASLSSPIGLAFDSAGNLYIGDYGNNRIRRVDTAMGIITTYAGNGTRQAAGDGQPAAKASLNPAGIAFDSAGNLFIADVLNNLVRRIDRLGIISTVAGDGFTVVCDIQNNLCTCLRGVAGAGRLQNGVEGGPARRISLNFPQDVTVDPNGIVYVADTLNHRIRRLTPDGQIVTISGTGTWDMINGVRGGMAGDDGPAAMATLNKPTGITLDRSGNLLFSDFENDRIRKIDPAGMIGSIAGSPKDSGDGGPASSAATYVVQGVTTDAGGNIYFSEPASCRVRLIDARTGVISSVAGNGKLGESGDGGPATEASLAGPVAVVVDSEGDMYIAEFLGNRIRKVSRGVISTYAGDGTRGSVGDGGQAVKAQFKTPVGLALDAQDNLYIADSCNHKIRRVDRRTGIITTVAGNGSPASPVNPCNPEEPCKGTFAGDGGPATQASLWSPLGVAINRGNGNIYIADTLNFRVRVVDGVTQRMSTLAGDGIPGDQGDGGFAAGARFSFLGVIALDPAGNVLLGDGRDNNRIRRIDRVTGQVSTIIGNGFDGFSGDGGPATSARLRGPSGIAVVPGGSVVFTDSFNHRVRLVK